MLVGIERKQIVNDLFGMFITSKKFEDFNPGKPKPGLMSKDNKERDCRSCFYFLSLNGVVVYVGITKGSLLTRLYEHQHFKFFDTASIYETSITMKEMREIEKLLINLFDPYFNLFRYKMEDELVLEKDYQNLKASIDRFLDNKETRIYYKKSTRAHQPFPRKRGKS